MILFHIIGEIAQDDENNNNNNNISKNNNTIAIVSRGRRNCSFLLDNLLSLPYFSLSHYIS